MTISSSRSLRFVDRSSEEMRVIKSCAGLSCLEKISIDVGFGFGFGGVL